MANTGVPAWTTLPGRIETLDTQPLPGDGDVGLDPLVRRLVEAGGSGAKLDRRRGHGDVLVLLGGEVCSACVESLQGVMPGLSARR